ncbi:hypothetical protein J2X76_006277 [Neorhizobium sp. 2083]|uniref:hypothetical protein n=1 Tax=Neorhizobium sp. 2083 TaxID=2817762 RepID=UPI002855B331|nr:hypothetical protein [Neorhizobium sp. 2083]MDR6821077.1 hypothetical protein [Neorhizobium sp. 2083]
MSRRTLVAAVAGFIIVLTIVIAVVDQAMMSAEGDHPPPAVRDPRNPAAPAPSQ